MSMHVEECAKNQAYINELNVNPADIVSVYDALCSCDPPKLLDAALRAEIGRLALDVLPAGRKDMLLCRLKASLEVMRNLDPCSAAVSEVLAPGKYHEALHDIPWPQTLAMNLWLPERLDEQERYFILGQVFSAMACEQLMQSLTDAA